jgi:glucokinase
MILAGDIGGTKTNLAYYELQGNTLVPVLFKSYSSQHYTSLNEILALLLREHPERITAAAFGIAGPVVGNRSRLTNVSWVVDGNDVASLLHLESVGLLNDLAATAYGILRLDRKDIVTLQPGTPQREATIGVIAAGTGLGGCALVWDGRGYRAMPSEGGHADFPPRNELEIDLLKFLLKKFEHVSVERVIAGPGIINIYEFFRSLTSSSEPSWLTSEMQQGDPSAAVSRAGLEGKDEACVRTLEMFVTLYGSEAGNLALRFLTTAGLYVAGGIVPKILPKIQSGLFMEAFLAKDTYRELLQTIPVHVVLNEKTALLGAAHYALTARGEP